MRISVAVVLSSIAATCVLGCVGSDDLVGTATYLETEGQQVVLRNGGLWGGEHASLLVSTTSEIEYDCGRGRIEGRIPVEHGGTFDVQGYHVLEGGPIHLDEPEYRKPARYHGHMNGGTMVLSVAVEGFAEPLGPFELSFGIQPLLYKCL